MNVQGAFPGPVYSAAAGFLPAATATGDIFTIAGAAGYLIRVLWLDVVIQNSAAVTVSTAFTKRSALDTGGTSSVVTGVPHDSGDPAAQAVVKQYTAMPATGAAVGNVRNYHMDAPFAGSNLTLSVMDARQYPIILRSATELLAVQLGTSMAAPNARCNVMWCEEVIV